ncbi:MAG: hypothetical protein ACJARF_001802, partial [Alteromonadaceae bacterium]
MQAVYLMWIWPNPNYQTGAFCSCFLYKRKRYQAT